MNKGECGELLTLALACCEFSIHHAEGSAELSLVAVGKGFDKGEKVLRYFDPGQDERQVVDFSVDYASPDTAGTQRHEFGFIWDHRGVRFDHDINGEINKFNENGDVLPSGRYYTHTIMAYRHRPDEVIFKKNYLDKWRDQERQKKLRWRTRRLGDADEASTACCWTLKTGVRIKGMNAKVTIKKETRT